MSQGRRKHLFVESSENSLGIGKVIEINGECAAVDYFLSPVGEGCFRGEVATKSLVRKELFPETRAYYRNPDTDRIEVGRILAFQKDDNKYFVRFPNEVCRPALQNILEKSVRELGAIRLIDSSAGTSRQLARKPRGILGRFRTTIRFASLLLRVLLVNLRLHSTHPDIHRTSRSLGRHFCWTHDTDAAGLAGVASDRHHRWLGILDFATRTGHRAVVL